MTINELITQLSALPEETKKLRVGVNQFCSFEDLKEGQIQLLSHFDNYRDQAPLPNTEIYCLNP